MLTSYTWSKIKGEQGPQGIKGVAWSGWSKFLFLYKISTQNANGNPMTDSAENAVYIGTCSTTSKTAPKLDMFHINGARSKEILEKQRRTRNSGTEEGKRWTNFVSTY